MNCKKWTMHAYDIIMVQYGWSMEYGVWGAIVQVKISLGKFTVITLYFISKITSILLLY